MDGSSQPILVRRGGAPAPTRELRQLAACGPTMAVPLSGHSSSSRAARTHTIRGIGRWRMTYSPSTRSGRTTQFLLSPVTRGP